MPKAMHPSQFQVDQAWIAFKLNYRPIRTSRDEWCNCVCLMDAASVFILGTEFFLADEREPSNLVARRLLDKGFAHHEKFPTMLFIPTGQFETDLPGEAERQGITVVRVSEKKLLPFIREARDGFNQYQVAQEKAEQAPFN